MDYFGLIKKAYQTTVKHRYLWIFGILAGGIGSGFSSSFNSSTSSSEFFSGKTPDFGAFFTSHATGIAIVAIIIVLLGILWSIFSVISQGAILNSVRAISRGEKNNFMIGVRFGLSKFWRIFALGLLVGLGVVLSLVILVVPVILFVVAKIYVLAVIYGILVFLLDLVFWLYLGLMGQYILRLAVLSNIGSWQAIVQSGKFFIKHIKDIIIIYLLLMAVNLAITLGMILAILVVGGLLVAIGFGLYLASMAVFWMYVAVFGFAFIVFVIILGGVISTFKSSVYTLAFLEMTKNA